MNLEERRAFADLLHAHGFDGVQYTNNYEPHGHTSARAYFVLDMTQIKIVTDV